jgi:hypothetical protein
LQALLNAAMTLPLELARPLEHVDVSAMGDVDRRGTMGEWAVALGLGLRMTKERFAPAGGESDNVAAAIGGVAAVRGSSAQVVDMEAAVRAAGGAGPVSAAVKERGPAAEATHA